MLCFAFEMEAACTFDNEGGRRLRLGMTMTEAYGYGRSVAGPGRGVSQTPQAYIECGQLWSAGPNGLKKGAECRSRARVQVIDQPFLRPYPTEPSFHTNGETGPVVGGGALRAAWPSDSTIFGDGQTGRCRRSA